MAVVYATAPLISDNDGDLGNFSAPLKKTYSVSEADGDFFQFLSSWMVPPSAIFLTRVLAVFPLI